MGFVSSGYSPVVFAPFLGNGHQPAYTTPCAVLIMTTSWRRRCVLCIRRMMTSRRKVSRLYGGYLPNLAISPGLSSVESPAVAWNACAWHDENAGPGLGERRQAVHRRAPRLWPWLPVEGMAVCDRCGNFVERVCAARTEHAA